MKNIVIRYSINLSWWSAIIVASALTATLLTAVAILPQSRIIAVLWFMLVCPGMMLVRFFQLREPLLEWTLAVALSLAMDAIVGGVALYAGRWSPNGVFVVMICLTLVGTLVWELDALRTRKNVARTL